MWAVLAMIALFTWVGWFMGSTHERIKVDDELMDLRMLKSHCRCRNNDSQKENDDGF